MTEINFEFKELTAFTDKVKGYFSGIDSIIADLEKEKTDLQAEKAALEVATDFTAETLKRKATIGNELNTVNAALKQAQEERYKI